MKLSKRLASYPILVAGDDDYVDSYFDVSIEQNMEFGKIEVQISNSLNNKGLETLIGEKKACYVIHFECALLGYRKIVKTDKKSINFFIDLDEVDGEIDVSTFIVATQDIPKYYNEKFNWEYGKEGIDIDAGNILAIGPTSTIVINRSKIGFKKLSDVISIKKYETGELHEESSIVLESDIIFIYVNENIKNQYYVLGREYRYNMISMIMVPSMIYILTQMKNNKEDLKSYRWFGIIEKLLNQNGVNVEELTDDESTGKNSIFQLSQKIFKSPLEKGIMELNMERGERDNE